MNITDIGKNVKLSTKSDNANLFIHAVTTDNNGFLYITGSISDNTLLTHNPLQSKLAGVKNAFIAKIDPDAKDEEAILYCSYLGGSNEDIGLDIAVDGDQNAYITGITNSTDFPTWNAFQNKPRGLISAFISKIDTTSNDSLAYSSYLGGENYSSGHGIDVDSEGNAYITGSTRSTNFPVTVSALQRHIPINLNAYISKVGVNKRGESYLAYSTYIGGNGDDTGNSIAVDDKGHAYITGFTSSNYGFPVSQDALQHNLKGRFNAFLTKVDPQKNNEASLKYSTYIGGSSQDVGYAITVDDEENAYITGQTNSNDLLDRYSQSAHTKNNDAFAIKISTASPKNRNSDSKHFLAYIGGSGSDVGKTIALDSENRIYIAGITSSPNFPLKDAEIEALDQSYGSFICHIDPSQDKDNLLYSSYLNDAAESRSITQDSDGNIYLAGLTHNIPKTDNQTLSISSVQSITGSFLVKLTSYDLEDEDENNDTLEDCNQILNLQSIQEELVQEAPQFALSFQIPENSEHEEAREQNITQKSNRRNLDVSNLDDQTKPANTKPKRRNRNRNRNRNKRNNQVEISSVETPTKPPQDQQSRQQNLSNESRQNQQDFSNTNRQNQQNTQNRSVKLALEKPEDIIVYSDQMSGQNVKYPFPKVLSSSGNVDMYCTPPSGTFFPIGITGVNCSATDKQTGEQTFTYFDVIVRPAQHDTN